jgi:hypothetical protein
VAMTLKVLQEKLDAGVYNRNLVKGMIKTISVDCKDKDERTKLLQDWLDSGKANRDVLVIPENLTDIDVAKKYLQLQKSAESRNKEFNLSFNDVKRLMKRKTCYYTGQRFTSGGKNAKTVDRIDATKGYVKGNVVACTHGINSLKEQLIEGDNAPFKDNVKALKKFLTKI